MDDKDYQFFNVGLARATAAIEGVINMIDNEKDDKDRVHIMLNMAELIGVVRAMHVLLMEAHSPQNEDIPF